MAELSPMMQQYKKIKENYPDTLIFYRLGDFYEMFFEDAITASRELDLTLTGRDCGLEERAPMCGVPFHSYEGYLAKLISKGYKVAICEQMEDPATAKGLVKRDIIRVVTPGTVLENNLLDESDSNFLATVYANETNAGICFVDSSTGKLFLTSFSGKGIFNNITTELGTFRPKEILINSSCTFKDQLKKFIHSKLDVMCSFEGEQPFLNETKIIENHFGKSLEDLELNQKSLDTYALSAALSYLFETQRSDLKNINHIDKYENNRFMRLDLSSVRNLEIFETLRTANKRGSLLWAIDSTKTAMGKRMLRSWLERPLINPVGIITRQNAVSELFSDSANCEDIHDTLSGIHDLERLISRVIYGSANPQELISLSAALKKLPSLKSLISQYSSQMLKDIYTHLYDFSDLCDLIDRAIRTDAPLLIREGGIICPGFSEELDAIRGDLGSSKDILAGIESREREKTGISKLRIGYNRVFGYYIEVTNSFKNLVPPEWIRKQTLTGSERYITEELKTIETRLLSAKDRSSAMEYEIFCSIRDTVSSVYLRIQEAAEAVAKLDVICSFAKTAIKNRYVAPEISADGRIEIIDGRHPVVEKLTEMPFVPNNTILDETDNRCCIITGPNMAGKSTYMRQVALICILAQIGSYVPALSAHIGVIDAVFTRIGASDDLASGQSTFMVEMNEVANILDNATSKSLILLDEIGRGTSTYDGMAIAKSVLEYTVSKKKLGAKTLFATHYHELTALEGVTDGVVNYSVSVKKRGEDITFLHRIVRGGADRSYGIEVARLAGINNSVVTRAREILEELESGTPQAQPIYINEQQESQISFGDTGGRAIADKLSKIDVESLTPIEALNTLYELKKEIQ